MMWYFGLLAVKIIKKTNWWSKTASVEIKSSLTIRTAGTIKKIVNM